MTEVILPGVLTLDKINEIEKHQPTPKGAYNRELGSFATSGETFRVVTHRDFIGKKASALKQSFTQNLLPHKRDESWPEISVLVTNGKVLKLAEDKHDEEFAILVNEDLRAVENAQTDEDEDEAKDEDEN
jgi:hypothetical protein